MALALFKFEYIKLEVAQHSLENRLLDMKDESILIVEDDVIAQMTLKQMLEDMGYNNVHVASSKEETHTKLSDDKVDVILLDVFLNGEREGIEIARTVGEQSETPIIYLTASHDSETYRLMNEAPHIGILEKPYDYDDIYDALNKVEIAVDKKDQIDRVALDESELSSIFNAVASGICILNSSKTIIKVNKAFFNFFQTDSDLIGMDIKQILPDVHLKDRLGHSLSHKSNWEQELNTPKGTFSVCISTSNYKSNGELNHVITVTDISPQKENQRKLENQLEQNKVLRAEIQHRVKNSLNMVLGFIYLKEHIYEGNEDMRRSLRKIRERISTLSKVHSLYFREDFAKAVPLIDFIEYIKKEIRQNSPQAQITYEGISEDLQIDNSTGIKLGLVINEFILSSADFESFEITTSIKEVEDDAIEVTLTNHDYSGTFSIEECKSKIGFQILEHICRKENISYADNDEATIKVKIKTKYY